MAMDVVEAWKPGEEDGAEGQGEEGERGGLWGEVELRCVDDGDSFGEECCKAEGECREEGGEQNKGLGRGEFEAGEGRLLAVIALLMYMEVR